MKALWTCPKCGRKFVTRNMWHACGDYTVEGFLAGKGPRGRAMFDRFVALLRRCGPVEVAPAKTRVAFMVRVRFAGVSALSEHGMAIGFALRRPLRSPRIARVVQHGRHWYSHYMRVTAPEDLDDEVLGWLREAYRVGQQLDVPSRGGKKDTGSRRRRPS